MRPQSISDPICRDFDVLSDSRYGQCIQFPQQRKRGSLKQVHHKGPNFGLKLILNLNIDEYTFTTDIGNESYHWHEIAMSMGKR